MMLRILKHCKVHSLLKANLIFNCVEHTLLLKSYVIVIAIVAYDDKYVWTIRDDESSIEFVAASIREGEFIDIIAYLALDTR